MKRLPKCTATSMCGSLCLASLFVASGSVYARTVEKPNVIIILADDISARELPIYGSSVWTPPHPTKQGNDSTSDPAYRAHTPVLDRLARQGCYIQTAWAATVCSPSRAMLMTGRYAYLHKWWFNGDYGTYVTDKGEEKVWPLYESSPLLIGHVAQQAGYRTMWAGKTQMHGGDLARFGFDSCVCTPGVDDNLGSGGKSITDFRLDPIRVNGKKTYRNVDSGSTNDFSWSASSFYWQPSVRLMNVPYGAGNREWWPNTPESKAAYGVNTYGPDVELRFSLDFIEQQHAAGKPFFVYHAMHLGHNAFDFLGQGGTWTGTPIVKWTGTGYIREEPDITGDRGVYDTHSITPPSIHHQINYIDYQMWLYQKKLEELGIEDNTVIIFCADNGTAVYGKAYPLRQRGCHVPMIIYAPGMTKHGRQDILVNLADILPTLADIVGFTFPKDYEINGKSLWPYLTTDSRTHRNWVYSYQGDKQLIRGSKVLCDGFGHWWNVEKDPDDLDRYPEITDWSNVSEQHLVERKSLEKILPDFDQHETEHDAP